MEEGIKALPGVNNAVVSFLSQKVTIDAEDSAFESIVAEAVKICKKIEPDCEILLK
jgi:hypothetical protein